MSAGEEDSGAEGGGPLRGLWAYLICLTPFITDWLENGRLPHHPREFISEVVLGLLLVVCIHLLHRETARLRALVQTDSLTGLNNRRKFFDDLARETARARRLDTLLCLAYLDVDRFKAINDHHGHAEGDAVLRDVASMLAAGERRQVDTSYRLGGDEFAVLLVGAGLADAEAALARTLRERMPHCPVLQRHGVQLSFGVAQFRREETPQDFVRRTDHAMYAVKRRRSHARPAPPEAATPRIGQGAGAATPLRPPRKPAGSAVHPPGAAAS